MSQEHGGSGAGRESALQAIDPELNIFALANGVDLMREPQRRVLEWYREGMERRIHIEPSGDVPAGGVDLAVGAGARRESDKVRLDLVRAFREGVAPGELRGLLPEAIEAANALTREDVDRDGSER